MKPAILSKTADRKYWIKRYEFEGMEAWARAVALMPNGDIVVAGSIEPKEENAKSNGLVARLDKEGNVKWVRILGGSKDDKFNDVKIAPNGDIIIVGSTESFSTDGKDIWILRLDENGGIKWEKTYGGSRDDEAWAVAVTSGDIIVTGYTWSFGAGWSDFWILCLDENGNVKWQKTYGEKWSDEAYAVAITPNGDIIVAGYTRSFGANSSNIWILRLDKNGNTKWQKIYGGKYIDKASAVAIAPNGDIIVAGSTESFGAGSFDVWVLRLDENGNVKWQKTYGGSYSDGALAVIVAPNGDIIVAGDTFSFGAGGQDAWILRLDENGDIKWQKVFSGALPFNSLTLTPRGDIIVGTPFIVAKIPPDGNFPNCDLWKDTNAVVMDTNAVVKNTHCKVTVPPLKPGFFRKEYVKITDTTATVRTAIPKVEVLCEWSPGVEIGKASQDKALFQILPHTKVNVELREIPYVYVEGLSFPVKLTGPGGKILKKKAISDPEFREKLGQAILKLINDETVREVLSQLIARYGDIENLNINFAPSTLEFNGFSASPKEPRDEVYGWNINLGLGSVIFRPEKGNRILHKETIDPSTIQKIRRGASELMKLVELAREEERIEGQSHPQYSPQGNIPGTVAVSPGVIATPPLEAFPSSLLQHYEPLEFLGEGGFAKVFKARRREDGKIVALKIPRIDEKTSSLFIKEVAAWYNLNHENIVRLYRADILPVPHLEMEFVEGANVGGKLVRNLEEYPKPVDEETALKLIKGIAAGLKHAHSKGIYHLDLKPLNVLLKADLTPKITDWGLAKISARSSLSRHSGYSPLYAAPEQLDEETYGEPDGRTDVYQLGLIFYELLTGELPYKATSPGALVGKILSAKPKPISELKPGLKKFDGVFEKLLAKRKEERYGSVEEFLSALESLTELEREKEELRKTSLAMRKSRSREEFERLKVESVRKTVKIAILSAKLNDKAELLTALDDLKFYTRENLDDLLNAIAQMEMLLKEGIPISSEVEERIRALVLRIEGEALR